MHHVTNPCHHLYLNYSGLALANALVKKRYRNEKKKKKRKEDKNMKRSGARKF